MPIRQIGRAFTETVGRVRPGFPNSMPTNWDKEPGLRQVERHIEPRAAMGRKMTPKGPGKLKRK